MIVGRWKQEGGTPTTSDQNRVAPSGSPDSWIATRKGELAPADAQEIQPAKEERDHARIRVGEPDRGSTSPRLRLGALGPVRGHPCNEELSVCEPTDPSFRFAHEGAVAGAARGTQRISPPLNGRPSSLGQRLSMLVGERDVLQPAGQRALRDPELIRDLTVRGPATTQADGLLPKVVLCTRPARPGGRGNTLEPPTQGRSSALETHLARDLRPGVSGATEATGHLPTILIETRRHGASIPSATDTITIGVGAWRRRSRPRRPPPPRRAPRPDRGRPRWARCRTSARRGLRRRRAPASAPPPRGPRRPRGR